MKLNSTWTAGLIAAGMLVVPVAFAAGTSPATGSATAAMHAQARITMAQARKIALKAYSGTIVSEELEYEKGGSGLRYSFDIRKGSVVHEVGVDAVTGKILENDVDND